MRNAIGIISILIFASLGFSQDARQATLHVWIDTFGTTQGAILYPQYGWSVRTAIGGFSGFGFVESTPHEQMFTNHLVVYTPPGVRWFSIHTETGGFPAHDLGLFQMGPRINITEAVPHLKKPLARLFVVALPRFIGVRPNNIMVAGATNPMRFKGVAVWGEGYRRFFPHGPAYGEYWVLAKPTPKSPVSFGILAHHNGKNSYVGIGVRFSLF